ncbi:MAG: glycosyltransferase [Ginsengibacter sp.]
MKSDTDVFVILTPGFPANEKDDTCLPFLQHLIKAINRDFTDVSIIILSFQYPFRRQEYTWNYNTVISFGGKNRGKLQRRIIWIKVWRKLERLRKKNNIKGLFSLWLGECALLGKRFGEKHHITHLVWLLGQDAKRGNKYIARMRPVARDLVAVSDFIANEFFTNYLIRPAGIITNGVDTTQFNQAPGARVIDVLGAGSLISLKQYHIFVGIIKELKKKYSEVQSFIAGQGPGKDALQSLITNLELDDNISLPGEIAHGNLLGLMQRSKIFLHPSSYEGFSMVCQEALYSGCQVISFCKPMDDDIEHWHVVSTREEMLEKAMQILESKNVDHKQVLPYRIEDTAASIMKLLYQSTFTNLVKTVSN